MFARYIRNAYQFVWKLVSHVPLRIKIFGIVMIATCLTASSVLLWTHQRWHITWTAASTETIENHAFNELLVAVLIAMIVGLVIAWVLTNILSGQVAEVTQVAQQVQRGDMSRRAPVRNNDDIGALASAFNTMIDSIKQSHESLVSANTELGTRNRELTAFYELAVMATQVGTTDSLLSDALEIILETSQCDAGLVFEMRDDGTLVIGTGEHQAPILHSPASPYTQDEPVLRTVLQNAKPVQLELGLADLPPDYRQSPLCEQAAAGGFTRLYALPLWVHNQIGGVIVLLQQEHPASIADEKSLPFLTAICGQLSMVIENRMLWDDVKRREAARARLLATAVNAQEQERERISRELHDETGQALTALLIQLKVLENLQDEALIAEQVSQLRALVSGTLEEVRRLARDLRPGTLDELGLVPTIEWHLRSFMQNNALMVEFDASLPADFRLPVHTELAMYRIVQEALTNIARHANATQALIRLEKLDNQVGLIVQDDGCGFDVHAVMHDSNCGIGLLGIQERVELMGGVLQLESSDKGTRLSVEIPIWEKAPVL